LVTYAEKDGMELIAVVMKCNAAEHYTDTAALFDYGFANYEAVTLLSGAEYTTPITVTEEYNGKIIERGTITVAPVGTVKHVVPKGTAVSSTTTEMDVPQTIEAPVKAGQKVGTMKVMLNGKLVKTVDLVAQDSIDVLTDAEKEEIDTSSFTGILKKIGIAVGILLLAFIILLCITRYIGYIQHKKRKERRRRRAAQMRAYEEQHNHHEHHGYRHRRERSTNTRRRRSTNRRR
jgi:hypothetical protein